jgi:acyl carrier protein
MDFIELFDACVQENKPRLDKYTKPTTLDISLKEEDIGLDSLDVTLTLVLISDIYGIPETEDFNIPVGSLREVRDYMLKNKNKDFDSVEAAMESVT